MVWSRLYKKSKRILNNARDETMVRLQEGVKEKERSKVRKAGNYMRNILFTCTPIVDFDVIE